ncbi:MAG TPA: immune inhibitor A domain-containing protein, partial [Kribbella sp.]|nr:immune inhibitor A domain-containing protein [Kribbella sp.]
MRKLPAGLFSLALAATTGLGMAAASAGNAATPPKSGSAPIASEAAPAPDELSSPLEDKRRELRQEALTKVINGQATPEQRNGSTVVNLGAKASTNSKTAKAKVDQYVELSREKTDRIFVVLAEFGNERHPNYPDKDTSPNFPGPARFDGPLHNEIPAPDRSVDNSTVWQADYSRQHYQDMYFGTGNSLKSYYEKQSSGRYSVSGEVTDWVKVKYNEARYGRSNGYPCTGNVCNNTWNLI